MKNQSQKHTAEYNYEKIRSEVLQNIAEGVQQDVVAKPRKKLALWKRVCLLATYTLLVCAIACGCTFGVQKAYAETRYKNAVVDSPDQRSTSKDIKIIEKYFDNFVAFGGGYPNFISGEEILGCKFLSEEDKTVFEEYRKKADTEEYRNKANSNKFNVYLGQKDGKDIVLIYSIGLIGYKEDDIGVLVFESKLEYSFASIVEAFEKLSGKTLTQEFLRESRRESHYLEESGGIILSFRMKLSHYDILWSDGSLLSPITQHDYGEIYYAEIDGQIYGVTRQMLLPYEDPCEFDSLFHCVSGK